MTAPRVAILLVNWNGLADTQACLASLQKATYPNAFVVVVDNGSTDGSVPALRAAFPEITLVEAGENLGFVGGNNLALDRAWALGAQYALLLNNDTEVDPGFLEPLVEAAEADPRVGIVGPTIYFYGQPTVIWSAGGAIDWGRGVTHMLGLNEPEQGQFGAAPRPVDFVTGCALLIKREVVAQVGPLDPRFFAYFEEVEWCARVTRAGYRCLHEPRSRLWHKITLDNRGSPQVMYYMTRNRLLFLEAGRAGWRAWAHTLALDFGRTLFSWTVRPKWRHKAAQRRAMWVGIQDYFRRRFGRVSLTT